MVWVFFSFFCPFSKADGKSVYLRVGVLVNFFFSILQRGFFLGDMGERGDSVVFKGRGELVKTFSNMLNYFYNIFKDNF
jgi:hypothetical protein